MSVEISKIKTRIKSVSGALKVTNAMKLVSSVKLKRYKNKMLEYRTYFEQIEKICSDVLSLDKKENIYYKENDSKKNLYIISTSSLGLCGSYNANIFKLADVVINPNDDIIVLGKKGIMHYENNKINKINDFESYSGSQDIGNLKSLINFVNSHFLDGTYKSVHLIYSSYKNSVIFLAKDFLVLPLKKQEKDINEVDSILEPNSTGLIKTVIPIYIKTSINSKLLESEVCEQASRNNAMENASDNANEILDELNLQFNKARQAAITQEITEIVGASKNV